MKKIVLLAGLALSLCSSFRSEAQISINVQFGAPVVQQNWYDADDDYYYMPEQDCYYNVRRRVYVYPEGGRWVYANALPSRYGGFTYNNSRYYRVRERAPFNRNDYYRSQYRVANNYGGGYRDGYERSNGYRNNYYQNNGGYRREQPNSNQQGGNGNYGGQGNGYQRGNSNGYQGQNNGSNHFNRR